MIELDSKLAQMEKREHQLQSELDALVTELFKHLRATRDSKGRLIASFAQSAEPIAESIERTEGELALLRADYSQIKAVLGGFATIEALVREIQRVKRQREDAQRELTRAREIALRNGVALDKLDDDKRVQAAKARCDALMRDTELDELTNRLREIKAILQKY